MTTPRKTRKVLLLGSLGAAAMIAGALAWNVFVREPAWKSPPAAVQQDEPNTELIRLSPDQYRQIITDVFGSTIRVTGRFVEPGERQDGLLAVGASDLTVTSAGLEAIDSIAHDIAAQVFAPSYRDVVMPCKPANPAKPDDACAGAFLRSAGELLLRRPLNDDELQSYKSVASATTQSSGDFYAGLQMALRNLLISPDFLFRREVAEPDGHGNYTLRGFSRASRLSFLLWNSAPDRELLRAAAQGELDTPKGLSQQVDRLIHSPRLEKGVRAFFVDLLGFEDFAILNKDGALFPQFTARIAGDAQEQTLRTIVDLLMSHDGDYRDLFTTRRTFVTPSLGALYGIPVLDVPENGAADRWSAYEYPANDPRAGLLAQASFVALHSHPGRSSPTARGKALREHLLCQIVPPPPGDVDFSLVQDISNPKFKTARDRLGAHASQPACAGCHKITDPIGLALENFDGSGAFRTTERGALIDTSGELNGVKYQGPLGLAQALHNDPSVPACLVTRVFAYGSSRAPEGSDLPFLRTLKNEFAQDGYRVPQLLRALATNEGFYRAVKPRAVLQPTPVLTVSAGSEGPSNRLAADIHR